MTRPAPQPLGKRPPHATVVDRRAPGVVSVRKPPTGGGPPRGALHTTTVNLRTRLALLLGLLGAVASGAVALASYRVANGQLTAQVDVTLATYVQRLADPDGRPAAAACATAGRATRSDGDEPGRSSGGGDEAEFALAGAVVQCFDASGRVFASTASTPLPVGAADREVLAGDHHAPTPFRTLRVGDELYRVVTVAVPSQRAGVQVARNLGEVDRVLRSLRARLAVLALAATAGAALVGAAIAGRLARPVRALAGVAEDIAASGRLDLDVPVPAGRDETARLGRAFATMLDALRRSRDQQQRLVQDAGHELRTPLTSARTNVATLRRHPELAAAERDTVLADVDAELRELTTLANELVALSTDTGDDEDAERVDLAELADRAADRARRRSQRTIEATLVTSMVDGRPRQLLRAIDNLLDNAAKFSPAGTPIELAVADGRVTVRDHGPGIPAPDLPRVFDRFFRSTATRALPGSGLGLSIVQATAEAHGGRAVAANHPTGGAVLTLEVPPAPR